MPSALSHNLRIAKTSSRSDFIGLATTENALGIIP